MESFPLFLGRREIGRVDLSGADGKYDLYAVCPRSDYVYRVFDGEKSLGVMLPRDGDFVLSKKGVSCRKSFEILRCRPSEEIARPLPFALSQGEETKDFSFLKDELLKKSLSAAENVRCAHFGGKDYIYFPFADGESPMSPFFFCLSVIEYGGGLYAAFCLDGDEIKTIFSVSG